MSTETKRRKMKLRRTSSLELEANSAAPDGVHIDIPDGVPSARFLVGQEATPPVGHASPALEGAPVNEDVLALEGAAEDDPALEGVGEDDPVPEGPRTGSPSAVSMDVHVGSPLVRSEEVVVMSSGFPASPTGPATLEVGGPGTEDPMGAIGAEIPLDIVLSMNYNLPLESNPAPDTASISAFPFDSISMPLALGFPLFLSNLHVRAPLI
jgi:hypothetical protein